MAGDLAEPQCPVATSILQKAASVITGTRFSEYGPPKENFARIAIVWSAILKKSISAREVALMLAALKLCRAVTATDPDSVIDGAAYFALAEEVR